VRSKKKNGAPTSAVMIPMGRSKEEKLRAAVSAKMRNVAPPAILAGTNSR